MLEVNLISLMACAAKFHPMLKAAKGSLIIVSSTAAYHATKGNPAYNASKTGAVGLTRTLAQAWAEDGIRVNGIAPGLVDTKMTKVTTANPKRLEGAIETDSAEAAGHARRHGRRRAVPGLAAGVLYRRPHAGGRWRADFVISPIRHSGARLFGANPESSSTASLLDSGSAPKRAHPGMTGAGITA